MQTVTASDVAAAWDEQAMGIESAEAEFQASRLQQYPRDIGLLYLRDWAQELRDELDSQTRDRAVRWG